MITGHLDQDKLARGFLITSALIGAGFDNVKRKILSLSEYFQLDLVRGFCLSSSLISRPVTHSHVPKSIEIPKCNMETKTQQELTLLSSLVINELVPIPQRESLEALYLLITDLIHVSNSGRRVQMNSVQAQFWALFYGQSCGHNVGMTKLFLKIHLMLQFNTR